MSNIEEKNVPSILYAYDMTMSHTHTLSGLSGETDPIYYYQKRLLKIIYFKTKIIWISEPLIYN